MFSQCNANRNQLFQNGHRVRYIHDLFISGNLCYEIAFSEFISEWHSHSENKAIGILPKTLFKDSLGTAVKRAFEIGRLIFLETKAAVHGMLGVIFVNTASAKNGVMWLRSTLSGGVSQIQRTNNVAKKGLLPVVLTPIHVGSSSHTRSVDNVSGLDTVYFCNYGRKILQSNRTVCHNYFLPATFEVLGNLAAYPATASEQKKATTRAHFK
mmetsp:Transcript_45878/g.74866  ORF Transcript_45878/g.74866 Transcript_45878/m.74866 type:complete len:211 (+) Transcript_45878:524-1156(+)